MSIELMYRRIRNVCGFLGMILAWISLIGAIIVSKATPNMLPNNFWSTLSISATYYLTPALAGILTAASIVLMTYDGYTKIDSVITTISGVFGLLIVVFPCNCSIAPDYVGYFQLPANISNIFHCTSAVIFFGLLSFNSIFLFTKTSESSAMTSKKKIRNIIYIICGVGMLGSFILMLPFFVIPAKTFIVEAISLTFFGISWLVKGNCKVFPFNLLLDK